MSVPPRVLFLVISLLCTHHLCKGQNGQNTHFLQKSSLETPTDDILRWRDSLGIPMLEIDPDTIDTMRYDGWYRYFSTVYVANGWGYPLMVDDFNHNGKAEVYGIYSSYYYPGFETHIDEVDTLGVSTFVYEYRPYTGGAANITDVNRNGLQEIVFNYGDSSFFFEQSSTTSLPTQILFTHSMFDYPGTAIGTKEVVAHMDGDSLIDFVYRGSEPDSSNPESDFNVKTYVAEYDPTINNFKKVWSTQLYPPESAIGGYDVGDYDGDHRMEFIAEGLWGQVWVIENTGDNAYTLTFKDSLPFINMFYQCSGDVDGDGKREFFVGATMWNGNWTVVYETTGDNTYTPVFLFHLLSAGSFDDPTYLTRDMNRDGKLDLIILSGASLFIFTSPADNDYELWYYKLNDRKESIQTYDFNRDGWEDFIISKSHGGEFGIAQYADIFVTTDLLTDVPEPPGELLPKDFHLDQNYPNPFNASTNIRYSISRDDLVKLRIFNILGEEVAVLIDERKKAGSYSMDWNAEGLASGVYFLQLRTSLGDIQTRGMILMK